MYTHIILILYSGFSGVDYRANSVYVQRFLHGSEDNSSKCIDIPIIDNNYWDGGSRVFFLDLSLADRSYPFVLKGNNITVITIFDNECKHYNDTTS